MPSFHRFPLALAALIIPAFTAAQTVPAPAADTRARVLAASFNKSKHLSKEKRGVRKEKFLEITSAPAIKATPTAYSGKYEVQGMGFSLDLRVSPDGTVQGTGHDVIEMESAVMRPFTLATARVQGALLTATKRYADGTSQRFEGVFIDRTTMNSPTDPGSTVFGLGVTGDFGYVAGITLTRLFYHLAR
jgi:hypothetical protein